LIIVYVMGELVDARTAAQQLGVDIRSLYAYVSRGSLRRVPGPDGRSSRYDSDEVELLARRSRPRTLPRPAASIDLVIATRVSTVTDGVVRYRGTDVLRLVAAGLPFEEVADLLWSPGAGTGAGTGAAGWRPPAPEAGPCQDVASAVPVLHRFAIMVAAVPASAPSGDPAPAAPAVDWPGWGRRIIACLIAACQGAHAGTAPGSGPVAHQLWTRWSPLRPTAARVRALNTALVLLAEHELALSTLAVRVAASARAAPAACVLAGLSTLSGTLHGGAARAVHESLLEAARRQAPDAAAGRTGPLRAGFGHPVHAHGDPRTAALLDAVCAFATPRDRALLERARAASPAMPNVDFALGWLTYAARMPPEAATAIFAIARVAGWIAHAAEEYAEPPLRFRGRAFRPRPQLRQGGDDLAGEQGQAGAVVGQLREVADGVGHAQGVQPREAFHQLLRRADQRAGGHVAGLGLDLLGGNVPGPVRPQPVHPVGDVLFRLADDHVVVG
jgi:citrate synthase